MASLPETLTALESLAPLSLAGDWDNVGLLLAGTRPITHIGICIDLTEPVLDELEQAGVDLVCAYHPPLFRGLKRITGATGLERVLLRLLRAGTHLYSPHSALDAADGGMADWLARGLGPIRDVVPLAPSALDPNLGAGRGGCLAVPSPLRALLPSLKAHLGLTHLRVAGDLDTPRSSFAVCPGAGGSLFRALPPTDLLVTGELGHHEVLAQVAAGGAVVLTDHTHSERGYLPQFATRVGEALPGVAVTVSQVDTDPLRVR